MRRLFTMIVLSLCLASSAYSAVIATATLHLKLTVPPPPITSETKSGNYDGYSISRGNGTITVSAI